MTYEIYTDNAADLIKTIFTCCENKKDPKGREITTWDVTTTKNKTKVLVHTTHQWENKCNIHLDATAEDDVVIVKTRYWAKYPIEQRSGSELDYALGRFTELMLVHFKGYFDSIEIAQ